MDGFMFEADLPGRVIDFVPPICLPAPTAQVLAIAIVILIVVAITDAVRPHRGGRR